MGNRMRYLRALKVRNRKLIKAYVLILGKACKFLISLFFQEKVSLKNILLTL